MSAADPSGGGDKSILDAAEALVQERGDDFTMDDLSARAAVSRATLYRRVGNKEALLQRLERERGVTPPEIRTRILLAARAACARTGLLSTTMEQIAAEAGIGTATLYRHFGDKEQLLRAVIAMVAPAAGVIDQSLDPDADLDTTLLLVATAGVRFLSANRDMARIMLTASPAERAYMEQLRAGQQRLRDRLGTYFAAQLAAGRMRVVGEPHDLAVSLMGLLAARTVFSAPPPEHSEETIARIATQVVCIFLDGVRAPAAERI